MGVVLTPEFRVSYPHVFTSSLNKLSNKMEFSLEAIFPPGTDLKALQNEAVKVLKEEFGDNVAAWPTDLKKPFKKHEDRTKTDKKTGETFLPDPYEVGGVFLSLRSLQKPGLVDESVQPIIDPSLFYAGCYARAAVNAYAYRKGGNVGVNFGLQHIQYTRKGDPLGNRTTPEEAFTPIEGADGAGNTTDPNAIFGM